MTKFTHGPWNPEYDNSDSSAGGWWYRVGPAEVWASYRCSPDEEARVEADARLIAMAPEMYKLLTKLEKEMILSTPQDFENLDRIREILSYIDNEE